MTRTQAEVQATLDRLNTEEQALRHADTRASGGGPGPRIGRPPGPDLVAEASRAMRQARLAEIAAERASLSVSEPPAPTIRARVVAAPLVTIGQQLGIAVVIENLGEAPVTLKEVAFHVLPANGPAPEVIAYGPMRPGPVVEPGGEVRVASTVLMHQPGRYSVSATVTAADGSQTVAEGLPVVVMAPAPCI